MIDEPTWGDQFIDALKKRRVTDQRKPGRMPVKKRFARFLKDEDVFWLYKWNALRAQKSDWPYKKAKPNNYLIYAFSWDDSNLFGMFTFEPCQRLKHSGFWVKIHDKWLNVLDSEGYTS